MKLEEIIHPTLLLDEQKVRNNIQKMAAKAKESKCIFRPHFKTPQSHTIGEWFKEYGVNKITVSSIKMAYYFAVAGWQDITIAIPVNVRAIHEINALASEVKLGVVVESERSILELQRGLTEALDVYIKINIGNNRSGIHHSDTQTIIELAQRISMMGSTRFSGIICHAGHSYQARNKAQILNIYEAVKTDIQKLKENLLPALGQVFISLGDTPTCSIGEDFTFANEMRPGNFTFYDVMQYHIGSCSLDEIAVCMACPIIGKNRDDNEWVIHGGSVHFSKYDQKMEDGTPDHYGYLVDLNENGWTFPGRGKRLVRLSQEHGIISVPQEEFDRYRIGDLVGILPIHSCTTADCMGSYTLVESGESITMLR